MEKIYDLLVVGAGSGGLAAARRARAHGMKVALFDKGELGGTCVNVGCIPKKIMFNASVLGELFKSCSGYGYYDVKFQFNWSTLMSSKDSVIKRLHGIYEQQLHKADIEYIKGTAKFAGTHTLHVQNNGQHCYTSSHILIATGSYPCIPNIPGADLGITSDDFFSLKTQPKHAVIVGGGYVAIELAGVLHSLGSHVTMIIRGDQLLTQFDTMIQETVLKSYREMGMNIHFNTQVVQAERAAKTDLLSIQLNSGEKLENVDCLLWAIGRNAQVSALHLDVPKIALNNKGFIQVDDFQNTNIPGIYGIGDVCGRMMLTPVAIAAGRKLADRLFQPKLKDAHFRYENIPTVVFSHPPTGTVGLTEVQARQTFQHIKVYHSEFTGLYYSVLEEKKMTKIKMICAGEEEKIVGLHVIGMNADEILQGFAVAIQMGAKKKDFDETVAIHPTTAEEVVTLK